MDLATMRRRAATAPVARLATVSAEGRPHLVPCCFALDLALDLGAGGGDLGAGGGGEVAYSAVDHKPKSTRQLRRLANVRANPAVTLLVDHYAGDWSKLWWVRLDGTGRIVDRPGEADHALELLSAKYPQYRRQPPDGPVLAVDITSWHAWP